MGGGNENKERGIIGDVVLVMIPSSANLRIIYDTATWLCRHVFQQKLSFRPRSP